MQAGGHGVEAMACVRAWPAAAPPPPARRSFAGVSGVWHHGGVPPLRVLEFVRWGQPVILTPFVMVRRKPATANLSAQRRELILAGLIAGIAPILGYTAFSFGFVGYVTTLFGLSTLMTVIWSSLFLQERMYTFDLLIL